MSCPLCQTKLVGRHRWFYWPLLVLGCLVLGIPLAYLGDKSYGLVGGIAGLVAGGLIVGLPFDKYLESDFGILRTREPNPFKEPGSGDG
jgi:hypothetical protein